MPVNNINNKPKMNMPKFNLNWLYIIIAVSFFILWFANNNSGTSKEVTYSEFKEMVQNGYADKIVAYNDNSLDMFVKPEYVQKVFKEESDPLSICNGVTLNSHSIISLVYFNVSFKSYPRRAAGRCAHR